MEEKESDAVYKCMSQVSPTHWNSGQTAAVRAKLYIEKYWEVVSLLFDWLVGLQRPSP